MSDGCKEEAHQRLLEACREETKKVIRDKSRSVFVIDQITYPFGVDVVREFDAFLNSSV